MVGITSYGAYVPIYRLSRDEIAKAWEVASRGGEKAVANFDEDSITMAVAASKDCIKGIPPETIDGFYLASTTLPYIEKQSSWGVPIFKHSDSYIISIAKAHGLEIRKEQKILVENGDKDTDVLLFKAIIMQKTKVRVNR